MNEEYFKLKYTKDAALRSYSTMKLSNLSSCESLMDWEDIEKLSTSELERKRDAFLVKFNQVIEAQKSIEKEIEKRDINKGVNQVDKLPEHERIRG